MIHSMKHTQSKSAFTLLETLIAITIIAVIMTAVYGTFRATVFSTEHCMAKAASTRKVRNIICQMTSQLRCASQGHCLGASTTPMSWQYSQATENAEYLSQWFLSPGDGNLISFVTAYSVTSQMPGMYRVAYKLTGRSLLYSEQRVVPVLDISQATKKRHWRKIADNITLVELTFYDGRKWVVDWDFREQKAMPNATKIVVTQSNSSVQVTLGTVVVPQSASQYLKPTSVLFSNPYAKY